MFFYPLIFQVITGGHYDVDLEVVAPNGQMLYKDTKKQYDTFVWTTDQAGVYKFCFSNEFSTFSHKVVYFDFQVGEEPPLTKNMESHATALTLVSKKKNLIFFCFVNHCTCRLISIQAFYVTMASSLELHEILICLTHWVFMSRAIRK